MSELPVLLLLHILYSQVGHFVTDPMEFFKSPSLDGTQSSRILNILRNNYLPLYQPEWLRRIHEAIQPEWLRPSTSNADHQIGSQSPWDIIRTGIESKFY